MIHKLGWKKDKIDGRDKVYFRKRGLEPPSSIDITNSIPMYDQGNLGSCTGNGIAAILRYAYMKKYGKNFSPSRLFIYYNERDMEGTVDSDSGGEIRDGIKSVIQIGVCSEELWPYDIDRFTNKPDDNCYAQAQKFQVLEYRRLVGGIDDIRHCLAEKFPVVYGVPVFSSFPEQPGIFDIPMPKRRDKEEGGHCMTLWGYNDNTEKCPTMVNWGTEIGHGGYLNISYGYLDKLASDLWMVELMESGE